MATQDMKAKLVIEAQTEGAGEVAALAAELEDLASQGSGAAPKFDALAQSLRELAAQDRLIDNFTRLRRETQTAGDAMDAASTQVDGLAAQLQQSGEAATLAAQAQASAARELDAARAQQAQLRDAIAATRAGLQQEREALAQAGHSRAQYTQETREAAGQLRLLMQEERQARATVTQLADAYRGSAAASRSAVGAQRETTAEYDRAVRGAGQLSGAVRQSNQALQQARDALQH